MGNKVKILTLGAGNMAQALLRPMVNNLDSFLAYTPSKTKAVELADLLNGRHLEHLKELTDQEYKNYCPDFLFLSFKPQQFKAATEGLLELGVWERWKKKTTVISMLAGTPIEVIEKIFDSKNIVRIMPNTPALVGKGITLYTGHPTIKKEILGLLDSLLMLAGPTFQCQSEEQLDKVTSVTGSGPAYVFEFTRIMQDFLKSHGLEEKNARSLAVKLILGSAELMNHQEDDLEKLRNNVTSKNGVTEAALDSLKRDNLESIVTKALEKNIQRSFELREDALKMK